MGTSLKIPGFKKLVKEFGKVVAGGGKGRVILVNQEAMRTAEWEGIFDYQSKLRSPLFGFGDLHEEY